MNYESRLKIIREVMKAYYNVQTIVLAAQKILVTAKSGYWPKVITSYYITSSFSRRATILVGITVRKKGGNVLLKIWPRSEKLSLPVILANGFLHLTRYHYTEQTFVSMMSNADSRCYKKFDWLMTSQSNFT